MHVNVRAYGATRLLRKDPDVDGGNLFWASEMIESVEALFDESRSKSDRIVTANNLSMAIAAERSSLTGHTVDESATTIDIGNLLDSSVPVINARKWLGTLTDEAFNVAALTLSDLLGQPSMVAARAETSSGASKGNKRRRIERRWVDGKMKILVDDDPLEFVSDGYRSVIAVGCDIMQGVGGLDAAEGGVSDLARARGIVMIDEVGAHLHPRWRMQITDRLRRAFPNVQFIITTHEPLCLRGLQEGEVIKVSKYEKHGVVLQEIDRSPARYRVDQLLTSEFFGLDSAIDPEVDAMFKRYYELQMDQRPEDPVSPELKKLDAELNNQRLRPVLGYTRRDQLMYEAIDAFLAAEDTIGDPDVRQQRRKATVKKVAAQWHSMGKIRR